jgi:dipeptidyl aminopeptidase/acylaminoacyl peptidase
VIQVWDGRSGKLLRTLPGHEETIRAADLSPDGRTLVSTSFDVTTQGGVTKIWDLATGNERHVIPEGGDALRISGDGGSVFLAVPDQLRHYRLDTGEETRRFLGPHLTLAIAADGLRTLALTSRRDTELRLFDATAQREAARLAGCETAPRAAAFAPDGRTVAAIDGDSVRLWEVATGRLIHRLADPGKRVFALAFSPDSRFVATAGLDKVVRLWEVATGEVVHQSPAQAGILTTLAFSADTSRLVSGGTDRSATVWEAEPLLRSTLAGRELTETELDDLWTDLASAYPAKAYRAMGQIEVTPAAAVPFLLKRVEEITLPAQTARIRALVGDLDSPSYKVRRAAMRELEKLRAVARPILEEFYETANAADTAAGSAETRSAIRRILAIGENAPRFTDEDIRRVARLVESLRRVEQPEADQILRLIIADFPDESVKAAAREVLTTHGG